MTAATPSRLGLKNGTGADDELFLKVFSGEVLSVYHAKTIMADKTRVRNIKHGKSASFNAIGRVGARYHVPGTEITGQTVEHGETIITIDDLLISDVAIAQIDEAKNHYEVRSEYSTQMGVALAQTFDRNLLSLAVKAARAGTAGMVDGLGAAESTAIGATPTIQQLVDALYAEAAVMDELYLPAEDRFVIVSPTTYWGLVQNDKLLDRDFGGNGSYQDGTVIKVAGMTIAKSANLAVDHTAAANADLYPDFNSKYAVDASNSAALILQKGALGTVKLMEMSSEGEWDLRRQVTLMLSKMAVGHGIVDAQGIRELRKA